MAGFTVVDQSSQEDKPMEDLIGERIDRGFVREEDSKKLVFQRADLQVDNTLC